MNISINMIANTGIVNDRNTFCTNEDSVYTFIFYKFSIYINLYEIIHIKLRFEWVIFINSIIFKNSVIFKKLSGLYGKLKKINN